MSEAVDIVGDHPVDHLLDADDEQRAWFRALLFVDRQVSKLDAATLVVALMGIALLAALGAFLRLFHIPGTESIDPWLDLLPRYGTLAVAMLGAALATRQGGHIAIAITDKLLPERIVRWTRASGDGISAIVCVFLAVATWEFIGSEREGGETIQNLLPSWVPATVMLWGFGIAAARFTLRAGRAFAPLLVIVPVLAVGLAKLIEASPDGAFWLIVVAIVLGLILGAPLFAALGGASLLLFWNDGSPIAVVPLEMYRLSEQSSLVTLPLFTLMGAVLAKSGAPGRLVAVARAWLGWAPGGLAVASVVLCAFFTTFSGASGVTILALGLLLQKMLLDEGYPDGQAVGLITASGSIGLLFAPALPLILYGIVAKVDIDHMFAAGVGPGLLLIVVVSGAALLRSRGAGLQRHTFVLQSALTTLRAAVWELLLPLVILGLLLSGMATLVESAAIGAIYALFVEVVVHRDISIRRDLPVVVRDSGVLIGAVLVILGVALAFTYFLVDYEIPQQVVAWSKEHVSNKWVFLLGMNLLLLGVGMLLDIFSAIIVFVPLLLPVAIGFGIDPAHLGIIFLANLEIGYLTPPVGMNLFLSSIRFKRDLHTVWPTVVPFLLVLLGALLVITYVPALSLWWQP